MLARTRALTCTGWPDRGCCGECSNLSSHAGAGVECLAGFKSAASVVTTNADSQPSHKGSRAIPLLWHKVRFFATFVYPSEYQYQFRRRPAGIPARSNVGCGRAGQQSPMLVAFRTLLRTRKSARRDSETTLTYRGLLLIVVRGLCLYVQYFGLGYR